MTSSEPVQTENPDDSTYAISGAVDEPVPQDVPTYIAQQFHPEDRDDQNSAKKRRPSSNKAALMVCIPLLILLAMGAGGVWLVRQHRDQQTNEGVKALQGKDGVMIHLVNSEWIVEATGGAIEDVDLAHIAKLNGPLILSLNDNPDITDKGVEQLHGMTNIIKLDLSRTGITDAGMAHLGTLTGLTNLDLDSCEISGQGLAHVVGLSGLRELILTNTSVGDESLESLKRLSKLDFLILTSTKVTPSGISDLKRSMPEAMIW